MFEWKLNAVALQSFSYYTTNPFQQQVSEISKIRLLRRNRQRNAANSERNKGKHTMRIDELERKSFAK